MNSILSTKVLLRKDTAERWEQFNPLLLNGETAIVIEKDGNVRLKVGDGEKTYNQLPFLHEYAVETRSINQGMQAFARPYGIAGGFRVSADSQFAQVFGINASTSGDNYSFVWNGDNDLLKDAYTAHGDGTFNINPVNGLSGFYINDRNLSNIIYTEIERKSTTFVNGEKKDLSVFQVSLSDYIKAVNTSSLLSDAVYIVSSDIRYMFGERISDLGEPELSSDAATKYYVDTEISKIDVSEQIDPILIALSALSSDLSDHIISVDTVFQDIDSVLSTLSNDLTSKIVVANGKNAEFIPSDLSIRQIDISSYVDLLRNHQLEPSVFYAISCDGQVNALEQPIINVGEPVLSNDAATKGYVDQNFSKCLVRNWYEE